MTCRECCARHGDYCWGVKEVFLISDLDHECTEYPHLRKKQPVKTRTTAELVEDMETRLAKFEAIGLEPEELDEAAKLYKLAKEIFD